MTLDQIKAERKAFEAWLRDKTNIPRTREGEGYFWPTTEQCWKAWKTRAELAYESVSPGPATLADCMKCQACGHSVTGGGNG